jgi:dTDP-4-amino-4,6-dideoxygalactose transaminase
VTKNVPFFNYKVFSEQHGPEINKIMQRTLNSGAFIMQNDLAEFEQKIAKFIGVKHALGVANATDGLMLALRAVGVNPGDEVIFPSHTFVATAGAAYFVGATPIPVECREDHTIDPNDIERAITSKTKAIMPVQLNGRMSDMDAIQAIADKHGLVIVEDAAQALGSKYKGQGAGTCGAAAAFSFYPAKVLGCLGDGGLVTTNDDRIADKLFMLRDHGRNCEGEMVGWGLNSRLDNMQAAILNYLLDFYPEAIARRRKIAAHYQSRLSGVTALQLPPAPDAEGDYFDVYQNYEIEANDRDALQSFLKEKGVGTLKQWNGEAVHQIQSLGIDASLPNTDKMTSRYLMLPMNMSVNDEEIDYVCDQIDAFYQSHANTSEKQARENDKVSL